MLTAYHDRDFLRVATESPNIVLYPFQGKILVQKTKILAAREKLLGAREPKCIGAVVNSHDDDILVLGKTRLRKPAVRH